MMTIALPGLPGVLACWLVASLPAWLAWAVARRRRMPREARSAFAWLCLLASHGMACAVAAVVAPLLVALRLAEGPWVSIAAGQLVLAAPMVLLATLAFAAGGVVALGLPFKLCGVWPLMRAARRHALPLEDPAERRG